MTATAHQLDAFWMPFTANRDYKKKPRMITGAKGHFYTSDDGAKLYDTFSGLWTSGLGHSRSSGLFNIRQQYYT